MKVTALRTALIMIPLAGLGWGLSFSRSNDGTAGGDQGHLDVSGSLDTAHRERSPLRPIMPASRRLPSGDEQAEDHSVTTGDQPRERSPHLRLGDRSSERPSTIPAGQRADLAAAVHAGRIDDLTPFMALPYGEDPGVDGLLIEAARILAMDPKKPLQELGGDKLESYLKSEMASPDNLDTGSLIQISEALAEAAGRPRSASLVTLVLSPQVARPARATAALALAKQQAPGYAAAVKAFRDGLEDELSTGTVTSDERPFVLDTIREMDGILENSGLANP